MTSRHNAKRWPTTTLASVERTAVYSRAFGPTSSRRMRHLFQMWRICRRGCAKVRAHPAAIHYTMGGLWVDYNDERLPGLH
jgi:hypothetical protein